MLLDVAMLHATMRAQMLQLCSNWARVLPTDPFFLWKDTETSVCFRFRDTIYTLCGLTGTTESDNSFRFEFDYVSRQRVGVLSVQLKDSGLLGANDMQACARQQEDCSKPDESDLSKCRAGGLDRRMQPRFNLATSATLSIVNGGVVFDCEVIELSRGGCRIKTTRPLNYPLSTRVEVQFVGCGLPLRFAAEVRVKVSDYVIGLKYLEVSPRVQGRLSELIEELATKEAPRG
jgi:hypothetical protein